MSQEQRDVLERALVSALAGLGVANADPCLARPKDSARGDWASTAALRYAKALGRDPRELAAELARALLADPLGARLISDASVAGPGFVNLSLRRQASFAVVSRILRDGSAYGRDERHTGRRALLEYVSANPTGPLHLGHARQAALGDVLARLLATQGWTVTREFYYNDAGAQIDNLTLSVQARGREARGEAKPEDFPEQGYHGDYIAEIAADYLAGKPVPADGGGTIVPGALDDAQAVRRYAVAWLRREQDQDLRAMAVSFDSFFLESSLYADGQVEKVVGAIARAGFSYEADGALWLRTTDPEFARFHDDKDRVMRKRDGHYTYFVPDVAYHLNKFGRGYDRAINIQGSDHHGTMARVRVGLQAAARGLGLSVPPDFPEYLLHKMLLVTRNGQEVKMSKRAGTYVTLRDLVDWVGADAARYFLVSRKSDAEFVFDVDLALKRSDENPVYYLQYAHARICSVLAQSAEKGWPAPPPEVLAEADLSVLDSEQARALAAQLAEYGPTLSAAARELAPHLVCVYLKDLAALFHAFYNSERVLVEDPAQRHARLALLLAVRQVLRNGLEVLGVTAPERM